MLRNKKIHKKLALVGLVTIVTLFFVGMMSDKTYTFLSRADEEKVPVMITDLSEPVIVVPEDERPACVRSMQYLPKDSDSQSSCFTQFECEGGMQDTVERYECFEEQGIVTCDIQTSCPSVQKWKSVVAKMCGC